MIVQVTNVGYDKVFLGMQETENKLLNIMEFENIFDFWDAVLPYTSF